MVTRTYTLKSWRKQRLVTNHRYRGNLVLPCEAACNCNWQINGMYLVFYDNTGAPSHAFISLIPRPYGRISTDDIFVDETCWVFIRSVLQYFPNCPFDNTASLMLITAWRYTDISWSDDDLIYHYLDKWWWQHRSYLKAVLIRHPLGVNGWHKSFFSFPK